jgi:ABC-2 type transport system ATP-binding protein
MTDIGGMEFALNLMHEPKDLLRDALTVGLDSAAQRSVTELVHDLADQGLSVLWATHLSDKVRDTDDLLVLLGGRIRADGNGGAIRGTWPYRTGFWRPRVSWHESVDRRIVGDH